MHNATNTASIQSRRKKITFLRPGNGGYELMRVSGMTNSMPRQISKDYAFGVIEDGSAHFSNSKMDYEVTRGHFLALNPGDIFCRRGSEAHPRSVRAFSASPAFLESKLEELLGVKRVRPHFCETVVINSKLTADFTRIHEALEQQHSSRQREKWLTALVALLLEYCNVDFSACSLDESERVKKARRILNEKFCDDVSLTDLATQVGLSPQRLNRIFSQEIGIPPRAYLTLLRVWHAKKLIETGMSIADAAQASGFYDQAHLTRHFKKLNGYTPGVVHGTNLQ